MRMGGRGGLPVRGMLRVAKKHDLQAELFAVAYTIASRGRHNSPGEIETKERNAHAVFWVQHAVVARYQSYGLDQVAAQAAKPLVATSTARRLRT